MDNGLKGLLEAERAKLMRQVAAIDAVLGQATVGTVSNGNGHQNGNGNGHSTKNVIPKRAIGVSTTLLEVLASEERTFLLAELAQRLKARGVYPQTISNRKLASRTTTALYSLQYAGKAKRSDDGTWAVLK